MFSSFISQKFLEPLCHYYTLEATIAYGLILCAAAYGTYILLQKLKIKIDKYFFYALIPFILYGGWTRALRDHNLGIYTSKLFCSPPIYFVIFFITIASLLLGILVEKYNISNLTKQKKRKTKRLLIFKIKYYKTMIFIGSLFLLYNLSLTRIADPSGILIVLGIAAVWTLIFFSISFLKPKLLSKINAGIITAHLLDASATFTALSYFGYYEQHVLPSFLIGITGPWVMFPLKIIVVWSVLYIMDKYSKPKDKFFISFLKIIIFILGLALGIRDMLTLSII